MGSAAPPAVVALAGRPDTHGSLEGAQFCLVRIGEGLGTVLENERVVVGEVVEDAVPLCHLIDTRAHHRHHWVSCALVQIACQARNTEAQADWSVGRGEDAILDAHQDCAHPCLQTLFHFDGLPVHQWTPNS